jgi:hypothetical protein
VGNNVMVSLIMTMVAMVPIVAMLSLSISMYKWQQQHVKVEDFADEYIYACRKMAHVETHYNNINEVPKDQRGKMSNCDNRMLYYKGRCELDSSKFYCSNSAIEGYLILRGIENAERSAGFTTT